MKPYELVSSRESRHVGYEPTGTSIIIREGASREEIERAKRIFTRVARRNNHPNLHLSEVNGQIFVFSNQYQEPLRA